MGKHDWRYKKNGAAVPKKLGTNHRERQGKIEFDIEPVEGETEEEYRQRKWNNFQKLIN